MITLYSANTPNGVKVTIMMEELGEPYELKILNLGKKEQKTPEFLAINPNGRIPAITDEVDGQTISVFESGAVLLYLAEKFGRLLPADPAARIETIAWTYFQTGGIGPMMGQAGYFRRNHPEFEPGYKRYHDESLRLLGVLDEALSESPYLVGEDMTIADIMQIGWIDRAPGYAGIDLTPFSHVRRWHETMLARPGVKKGMAVLAG